MKPPGRALWLILALFAVSAGVFYLFSPAANQTRAMRAAQIHLETRLRPLLSEPRFSRVIVRVSTDEKLWVTGEVAGESDYAALRRAIRESSPPCGVRYVLGWPDNSGTVSTQTNQVDPVQYR